MLEQMVAILVSAGATPASAAYAAVTLEQTGDYDAAQAAIVYTAVQPVASFSAELLLAEAKREFALVRRSHGQD